MLAALLLFALACAPEAADPCTALQDEIAACGFEPDAFECSPGDGSDLDLLDCMASEIAVNGCGRGARDYTDVTGPAFDACSE